MSTLPSDFIHDASAPFENQDYSTVNETATTISNLQNKGHILSKRKQEPEMDFEVSQGNKRSYTNMSPCARNRINKDQNLWEILYALKESSRIPGIIPHLEPHFTNLNHKGNTMAAYLCSSLTDYISTGLMDLGWGCGYRNAQMLMSFLQCKQQDGDTIIRQVPDVSGIQILLERAWEEGFDPQGARQLQHQVYKTRKWIGTTEVYSILCYLGIRSTILDFHHFTGPNQTHDALMDWIQSYFEGGGNCNSSDSTQQNKTVYFTNRPPLYLQHSGHSRTVIGIEILKDGKRNLIMFDPGRRVLRSYRGTVDDLPLTPTYAEDDIAEPSLTMATGEHGGSPCKSSDNDNSSNSSNGNDFTISYDGGDNGDDDDDDDDYDDDDDDTDEVSTPSESGTNSNSNSNSNNTSISNNNCINQQEQVSSSMAGFGNRLLSGIAQRTSLPANLLRPFRVDAKTIAKNRQYQLLVLGDVVDERSQGGQLYWDEQKGYLLDEVERQDRKSVISIVMTL